MTNPRSEEDMTLANLRWREKDQTPAKGPVFHFVRCTRLLSTAPKEPAEGGRPLIFGE